MTEQLSRRDGGLKTNRWQWGEDPRHMHRMLERWRWAGEGDESVGSLRGSWVHGVLFPDLEKA